MNKKAYITPLVAVTGVTTHYHICIGSSNKENPTNLDDVDNYNDNPGDFSRRHNQWDDEEEEEEDF